MSTRPLDELDLLIAQRVYAPLDRLRTRCRLYLALRGAVRLGLTVGGACLVQLLLDYFLRFSIDQRGALNAAITVLWSYVFYRTIAMPLLRPLADADLAAWVDRVNPALHNHLATAVQLAARRRAGRVSIDAESPQLIELVLKQACELADRHPFTDALDHGRARRRAIDLAVLAALSAAAPLLMPDAIGTWFSRNWLLQDRAWPQRTRITPDGFDEAGRRRLPRGEELEIIADVQGDMPASATLYWQTASGRGGRETMNLLGDTRLLAALGPLAEDVRFSIRGGDERTREYIVEAVDRPTVTNSVARIIPPAYTRLDVVELEHETVIEILKGGALEIDARVNKPLQSARLVGLSQPAEGAEVQLDADPRGQPMVKLRWDAPLSGAYRFDLLDQDGLSNRNPVRYTLKIVADQPPAVKLELRGVGEIITPQAVFPAVSESRDVYGLSGAKLLIQRADAAPLHVPAPGFEAGMRELQSEVAVDAAALGVKPAERLRIWAEATDFDPAGPNIGRSPALELRVVSRDEFGVEMARREIELRREMETLASGQRSVRETVVRLLGDLGDGQVPGSAESQRLLGLIRRQATHAGRIRSIAQRFEQILAEMQTSRTARPADERRMVDRLARPLRAIADTDLPAASDALAALRMQTDAQTRKSALQQQEQVLARLSAVLANMLEWEGFQEAVSLLEDLITEQSDVHSATLEAMRRRLRNILELDDSEEVAPATQPKP
ncbi:hypothetical protein RAS1_20870 [Phycisphaerae bacterium RAS1]|nr:hypothetical protein RAS1_20870 [Phycisphaerae bacterium RAS1]